MVIVNKNYYSPIMLCIYVKKNLTNSYVANICKKGSKGSVVIVLIIEQTYKIEKHFFEKKESHSFFKERLFLFSGGNKIN
jgi:hypothetical protein